MSRKINKSKSKKNKRRFRNKRKTMKGGIHYDFENRTAELTTKEQEGLDIIKGMYGKDMLDIVSNGVPALNKFFIELKNENDKLENKLENEKLLESEKLLILSRLLKENYPLSPINYPRSDHTPQPPPASP